MTFPPVIRLFFAVELTSSIKDEIERYIHALRQKSKSKAIRWTKPENLHITLQFLPSVASDDLPLLSENVERAIQSISRYPAFSLGDLRLYPSLYHPRVIVFDVTPQDALSPLAEAVGDGIKKTHYQVEERPFRAHLTIGRIKQPRGVGLQFLNEVEAPVINGIAVREVTLYRSEPHPEGSQYRVIKRMPLGGLYDQPGLPPQGSSTFEL